MEIGIVTQPLFANYGGFLQNYALQKVLKRMGHEPITIDYFPYRIIFIHMLFVFKTLFLCLLGKRTITDVKSSLKVRKRSERNEEFVCRNITTTIPVGYYGGNIVSKYKLKAVITGSDQVWRPKYNLFCLKDTFLGFVKDKRVRKIAYAVSFGNDNWEFSNRQTKGCSILAKQFNAISVRENSGIELCEKYLDVKAVEVLDPTLLLDKEDYIELCKDIPICNEQFLAAYVLDVDKNKSEFIQKIADEQQLPLKIFSAGKYSKLTIEEWVAMFRDAEFIITDSFHGTVFSIIFNKPFISLSNSDRGNTRFVSLLKNLDLSNRLIKEDSIVSYNQISNINWTQINKKLNVLKKSSLEFLLKSLDKL